MVSYETIPADPAEDGLLATPKPKTSLKRILGAAAVVSFALGAVSATALSMPAGVTQTMLNDPGCNKHNAPADWSDLSNKLNKAMDKEDGFIFRYRFDGQVPCKETHFQGQNDDGSDKCGDVECKGKTCGVAATLLTNKVYTENPVYCIQNDHGCDSPSVGYAVLDHWSVRGGELQGYAYYPTDANSVDTRDWKTATGVPGRGCHQYQQYLQVDDSHWVTYDSNGGGPGGASYYCKCDYDSFDPNSFGDYIVNNLGGGQPSYMGQDFSVCWLEESDPMDKLFEMQNSIYDKRGSWWNGAIGSNPEPNPNWDNGRWYQGWNEVAFDAGIDYKKNKDKLEALVVVMPSDFQSLCDFNKDIAQEVDEALNAYWTDGYGTLPVVIMKNTKEHGKYVKNTFRQTFYFENGNCIVDGGDGNNYYFVKSDGKC